MKLTVEEKLKFVKREQLCKVCTFSKAAPDHGNGPICPFISAPCNICLQTGDAERVSHHCLELHQGPRPDSTLIGPQDGPQKVNLNHIGQKGTQEPHTLTLVPPLNDVPGVPCPETPPPHAISGVSCQALSPTMLRKEGAGAKLHLSLKNLDFLRPHNLVSAIKIAFRTHSLFTSDVPHPSSHVGAEVRPPGNVSAPSLPGSWHAL